MLGAYLVGEPGPFGICTETPQTYESCLSRVALAPGVCGEPGESAEDECAGLRDSEVMPPRTGRT